MKKFLCLFMTVSLMAAMLGGCGSKNRKNKTEDAEDGSAEIASVSEEETSSVTYMSTMSPAEMSSRSEASSRAAIAKAVEEARKNNMSAQTTAKTAGTTSSPLASTAITTAKPSGAKTATTKGITPSVKYVVDPVEYKFANPIGKITRAWIVRKHEGLYIRISRVALNDKITRNFSSSVSSQIVNPKSITYNPTCNVAVITCNNPTQLKISTGNGEPKGVEEWSKSVDAVIAINGLGTDTGYKENLSAVIRNGSIFKSYTGPNPIKTDRLAWKRLVMYKDGRWEIKALDNDMAKAAVADGAYNTVRYQWVTIWDGQIVADTSGDTVYRNHTYLGQINEKTYVMMTTEFMSVKDSAAVLKAYGCKKAVQINGGNCTQMYVKEIGNTTGSAGAGITGLNKVGYLETEWLAQHGMLAPKKGGGPCADKLDVIYFK